MSIESIDKGVDNSQTTSVDIKPFDVGKLTSKEKADNSGEGKKEVNAATQHRKLTGKERAYVQYRIEHPLATKPEAIKAVYNVKPDARHRTLKNMATTIEKRPAVLAILNAQAELAEQLLTDVMKYTVDYGRTGTKEGAQYAGVAERTLNSVLDRVHGKAKQTIDVTTKSVNINVDLSN